MEDNDIGGNEVNQCIQFFGTLVVGNRLPWLQFWFLPRACGPIHAAWDGPNPIYLKFRNPDEAQALLQLQPLELNLYTRLIDSLLQDWLYMLREECYDMSPGDFLMVFSYEESTFPSLICQTSQAYCPQMGGRQVDFFLPANHPSFIIGADLFIFSPKIHIRPLVDEIHQGWVRRVKILESTKGSKLFAGITSQLHYDLGRWEWPDGAKFLSYSAKLGRTLLNLRK